MTKKKMQLFHNFFVMSQKKFISTHFMFDCEIHETFPRYWLTENDSCICTEEGKKPENANESKRKSSKKKKMKCGQHRWTQK